MNRILIYLTAFAICLSFEACEHSTEPVEKPMEEGHRNFPLHVGDTWKYEFIESRVPEWKGQILTLEIIEKQSINGQTYFLFDSDFPRQICPLDSGLFRVEGNKVIRLFEDKEYVWYDFGARPGEPFSPEADQWSVPSTLSPGLTSSVQIIWLGDCSELTIENIRGDSCYSFYFFDGTDASWNEVYAPDVGYVGIVITTFGFIRYNIRRAIIDGKVYEF